MERTRKAAPTSYRFDALHESLVDTLVKAADTVPAKATLTGLLAQFDTGREESQWPNQVHVHSSEGVSTILFNDRQKNERAADERDRRLVKRLAAAIEKAAGIPAAEVVGKFWWFAKSQAIEDDGFHKRWSKRLGKAAFEKFRDQCSDYFINTVPAEPELTLSRAGSALPLSTTSRDPLLTSLRRSLPGATLSWDEGELPGILWTLTLVDVCASVRSQLEQRGRKLGRPTAATLKRKKSAAIGFFTDLRDGLLDDSGFRGYWDLTARAMRSLCSDARADRVRQALAKACFADVPAGARLLENLCEGPARKAGELFE